MAAMNYLFFFLSSFFCIWDVFESLFLFLDKGGVPLEGNNK